MSCPGDLETSKSVRNLCGVHPKVIPGLYTGDSSVPTAKGSGDSGVHRGEFTRHVLHTKLPLERPLSACFQ
ncbi:hypothetical protein SKAU_G00380310 [Synaphobranchus kaupii]|uniref:Uncharacterized protein n=1 Tax=Synaphobranchus kaupii TaxID=118154 RepID=A0A9Q1IEM1_SYNKA|nr:hypothetical protein SKAU_G00380310 [Synaphobranchus kaupii]